MAVIREETVYKIKYIGPSGTLLIIWKSGTLMYFGEYCANRNERPSFISSSGSREWIGTIQIRSPEE